MPEIAKARPLTKAIIAEIIRLLRSGKSIKEIVMLTRETHENVRVIMHRYREVHNVFLETYPKRHPERRPLPKRIAAYLREV